MQQNEAEHVTVKDLHNVGVVARIIKKMNLPDGGVNLFFSVIKRFKITKTLHKASPIVVGVEYLDTLFGILPHEKLVFSLFI